jgi:hypothetical protein
MSVIAVKVDFTSEAKFFIFPVKKFVVGQGFGATFHFRNESKTPFPGGICYYTIRSEAPHLGQDGDIEIPQLQQGESTQVTITQFSHVTADGFTGVSVRIIYEIDDKGHNAEVRFWDGREIDPPDTFVGGFYAEPWESLYQYWALLVATVALVILVLEKIPSIISILSSILSALSSFFFPPTSAS